MKRDRFPTTRWSLIGRAAADDDATREAALTALLTAYWPCLRRHLIEVRRLPADVAEDVLQDFIAEKILAKQLPAKADPERGRFRNLLLTSLNRFLDTRLRQRRAMAARTVDLDRAEHVASQEESGLRRFERAWARRVVELALARMKAKCEAQGRHDLWEMFRTRVADPKLRDVDPVPYADLIARFRLDSPRQAINLLASSKRVFARNLRLVVAEYAGDEADVEREIADLCAICHA